MILGRAARAASFALASCWALLSLASPSHAVPFLEFVDPHPADGNHFGAAVVPLSTGNVVVTSPFDDAGGTDAGAVYLFNGATGALISTLTGSSPGDGIGSGGVTALANGNFVILSTGWDDGATVNVGAVTSGSGTTGVNGAVSAANSLVGSTANDAIGNGGVVALPGSGYLVISSSWDNGAVLNAGAVTWGNGATGVRGAVSAANSLVGSTANDNVGGSVVVLTNGNYVVRSTAWDNGAIGNAGAATWGNGTTGTVGVISAANSLVGTTAGDAVSSGGVLALSNGNYVVLSTAWDNGAVAGVGAATWGNGATGTSGAVSAANSLVGSTLNDNVGASGSVALTNGNYVIRSLNWDNVPVVDAGAATWCNGTTGRIGAVSAANSLVGSTTTDQVGSGGVTALSNGNYVVRSLVWDNGAITNAGAVTWGNGTTGTTGVVTSVNSLVGSTLNDNIGNVGSVALPNGNYVVVSTSWDNGAIVNAGAATWCSGTTGRSGALSAANSLVGSTISDQVGGNGIAVLTNGNYVVRTAGWDNGAVVDAGAATWGSGTAGVSGAVSPANSLVGSLAGDFVGNGSLGVLANGNYVVISSVWDDPLAANVGAATWGDGTTGVSGVVSSANSLVGSHTNDSVGSAGVTPLANGNYVVGSPSWDNGGIIDAGAATWGDGASGVKGVVSTANSLFGAAGDGVGGGVLTAVPDGNYVVLSQAWHNGALSASGAATWASGTGATSGLVSAANSLVGTLANTSLQLIVVDSSHGTFFARFLTEGPGRVRVGPISADTPPLIVSLADLPADQGGWLRLTYNRSLLDAVDGAPPIASYGVWRHLPGTLAAGALQASRPLTPDLARLRAALPPELDVRDVAGRWVVTASGTRTAGTTATFPAGTWEQVASIAAVQAAQYVVAIPTISNAAPNDFVVTAHTTTPSIWFISAPASAQSVDNLAPAQPGLFTAAYSGGQTNLQWAANTEHDLGAYRLHRGAAADFTPAIGNRLAAQISTSYSDVGPAGGFYKLSAVDVNGNESGFALVTPSATTGVGGEAPVVFALRGAQPNPAIGSGLHVAFALPGTASARLELLDLNGRRVLAREVGALGAGSHSVDLAEGRRVAPGLYWVRLTQGPNRRTARVAVIE